MTSSLLDAADTAAVSDALDTLGIAGVAAGLRPLGDAARLVGRVVTVQLGPADGTPAASHLGTAAIASARPGDAIVVANGGRVDVAAWGGNLALAAQLAGVAGIVVDGASRDVDEISGLGLPLFARAGSPVTTRGRVAERSTGEPVEVAGVRVESGDLVVADRTGVVFVPAARLDEVLAALEPILARERRLAERIRSGEPVASVMDVSYERMLERS